MSVIDNSNLGTLWNRILGLFSARKINNKSLAKDITINDEDIPSTAVNGETTVEGALGNIADQLSNQSRQIDTLAYKGYVPAYAIKIGQCTNVLLIDINTCESIDNRVGYIESGAVNAPEDLQCGIREVLWYSTSCIMVKVYGKNTDGLYSEWCNLYNGSTWCGWQRIMDYSQQIDTLNNKINIVKTINVSGAIATSDGTFRGAGYATVTLLPNNLAEIVYSYKVTVAGSDSSVFRCGISPTTLKNINPDIPNITPITGGKCMIYRNNMLEPTTMGYAAFNVVENGYWAMARVYDESGGTGGWSEIMFNLDDHITGVAYGTY